MEEWMQRTLLDKCNEQEDGKGKRKKKKRIKGKCYWPPRWVARMWFKNTHPWIHFWKRITHLCTPKEHVTFEIKIIPNKPTGICFPLPKWPQCKLAGSFHVRREHAACALTPWLIWQTEWTLQASVLLTSRPTVPCCIGVDIYETCQRGLLDLTNESKLKPTAPSAAWHCHPEAAPVTATVSWWLITMFTLVPLLWAFDRCAENVTGISAEKEKNNQLLMTFIHYFTTQLFVATCDLGCNIEPLCWLYCQAPPSILGQCVTLSRRRCSRITTPT